LPSSRPAAPAATHHDRAIQPAARWRGQPRQEPRLEPKFDAKFESKFEARFEPKREPKFEPRPEPKFESKFEAKPEAPTAPDKNIYDNLEEEMASLLGRPPEKS
jgi:hypothetical protein